MKVIFFALASIVIVSTSHGNLAAQTISIPHDTITATITTEDQKYYNKITNTSSSPITVTWKIIEHDFPADWQSPLAICDNKLCYTGSPLFDAADEVTDPIPAGMQGEFYVWPVLTSSTPGTHYIKIRMSIPLESKDSWYIFTKNASSDVARFEMSDDGIAVYPNPTNDAVTILHGKKLNVGSIVLVGLTGNVIKTTIANEEVTHISLGDLPSGLYFLRFTNPDNITMNTIKLYRN